MIVEVCCYYKQNVVFKDYVSYNTQVKDLKYYLPSKYHNYKYYNIHFKKLPDEMPLRGNIEIILANNY